MTVTYSAMVTNTPLNKMIPICQHFQPGGEIPANKRTSAILWACQTGLPYARRQKKHDFCSIRRLPLQEFNFFRAKGPEMYQLNIDIPALIRLKQDGIRIV